MQLYSYLHTDPVFAFKRQLLYISDSGKFAVELGTIIVKELEILSSGCHIQQKFNTFGTMVTHHSLALTKLTS